MILDLFAGPGGWSEGLRVLGLADFGVELDPWACSTRYAAGHPTWQADVECIDPECFDDLGLTGFIASPPCQDFSQAGARAGLSGDKGRLIWEPLRFITRLAPPWVALEQVPEALQIWKLYGRDLAEMGYSVWCGILNTADYGVPQTRERAILMARLDAPVAPPEPTHAEGGTATGLFGPGRLPWVSMGDVLGLDFLLRTNRGQNPDGSRQIVESHHPAPTLTTKAGGPWVLEAIRGAGMVERHGDRPPRTLHDPSFTVRAWKDSRMRWRDLGTGETQRFTVAHSLALQGFRPDYPVQGSATRAQEQIGNAVPPALAAAVVGALVGSEQRAMAVA